MDSPASTALSIRFDSPQQEAFLNLWRTYDCLKELEEQLFQRFELSAQQYNALRLLRSVHPESLPTLALGRRLISRSPDITRLLDRLERRELILRIRTHSNRRVVNVSITERGLSLLTEMQELVLDLHRRQLGHLSARELRQLVELLKHARRPHDQSCDELPPSRGEDSEESRDRQP